MLKFYRCEICGNFIMKIEDSGMVPVCCGQEMTEVKPADTDGAAEKHVPVAEFFEISDMAVGVNVFVGSKLHPMEDKHYIKWICLETNSGMQICYLKPEVDDPAATFYIDTDDAANNIYAFCNLHGLWKL